MIPSIRITIKYSRILGVDDRDDYTREAAILEPATSAESFAAAVARVLSDEYLRHSMRVAGIQRARKFSWERSVKAVAVGF